MRNRRILLVALFVAVVGGIAWVVLRSHQPVYKGKPVKTWIAELPKDKNDSGPAWQAIRTIGTKAVPYLLEAAAYRESRFDLAYINLWRKLPTSVHQFLRPPTDWLGYRQAAMHVLAQLAEGSRSPAYTTYIPQLEEAMREDRGTRFFATRMFYDRAKMQNNAQVVSVAARALLSPDDYVQMEACMALRDADTGVTRSALPAVRQSLSDPVLKRRMYAAMAFFHMGGDTNESVRVFIEVLEAQLDAGTQSEAASALAEIGPAARVATPALRKAAEQTSDDLKRSAARALAAIDPETCLAPYLDVLLGQLLDAEQRRNAADELKRLGPKARGAASEILEALQSSQKQDIWTVADALLAVAPEEGGSVIPEMIAYLKMPGAQNVDDAMLVLGRVGPQAAEALPLLKPFLKDQDPWMHQSAAFATLAIGAADEPTKAAALRVLVESLNPQEVFWYRRRGAMFLADLGKHASAALPAIVKAADDDDSRVARAAEEALKKFDHRAVPKRE